MFWLTGVQEEGHTSTENGIEVEKIWRKRPSWQEVAKMQYNRISARKDQ